MRTLDQRQQAGMQGVLACRGQVDKAEGLKPSLCCPHGEQDLCPLADGGVAEVKDKFDFELFVERFFQMHQTAAGRKLMQFAAYLALVGQSDESENGAAQLDPKRALLYLEPVRIRIQRCRCLNLRHLAKSMARHRMRHEVTKEQE